MAHFAGRTDELKALTGMLDAAAGGGGTVAISAIGGTAGVGKTALAVHWAHQVADRFPDGQLYVNLRGFDPSATPVTPADAVRRFLDALQVPAAKIPPSPEAQQGLYRSLLAGQQMLIVLDNARDAAQVRSLLPGGQGCLVLVTSRSQLSSLVAAEGAYPVTLDVLSLAEARSLLESRLGPERVATQPQAAAELAGCAAGFRWPWPSPRPAPPSPGQPLAALAAELRDAPGRLEPWTWGRGGQRPGGVLLVLPATTPTGRADVPAAGHPSRPRHHQPRRRQPGCDPSRPGAPGIAQLTRASLLTEHAPGRYAFHDLLRAYATELATTQDRDTARRGPPTGRLTTTSTPPAPAPSGCTRSVTRSPWPRPSPGCYPRSSPTASWPWPRSKPSTGCCSPPSTRPPVSGSTPTPGSSRWP